MSGSGKNMWSDMLKRSIKFIIFFLKKYLRECNSQDVRQVALMCMLICAFVGKQQQ